MYDWDLGTIDCPLCAMPRRGEPMLVRASASAKCPRSSAGGPSTSVAFSERPLSVGVGASKANLGIFLFGGGVLGVSGLVAGVSPLVKIPKGVVEEMCSKGSVSSKTDAGRDGLRFLEYGRLLLLQLRASPNGLGMVDESDAEDLVEEKVELRRNIGFRRAFKSPMIPSSSSHRVSLDFLLVLKFV